MANQLPFTVLQPYGTTATPGGLDGKALNNFVTSIRHITATTYTLQAIDSGSLVSFENSANSTLTIPGNLPEGFSCLVMQYNTGSVGFSFAGAANNLTTTSGLGSRFSFASLLVVSNPDGASAQVLVGVPSGVSAGQPPVNSVLPVISGTPTVGQVLTGTDGSWTGSPSLSRQWKANGSAIAGATGSTYTLTNTETGTQITFAVTGTNPFGTVTATSASVGPVQASVGAPVNTAVPLITGTTTQGQTLTASTGTWNNVPTSYAYQWSAGGVAISGATNSTYVLTASEVGKTVTVAVTASNAAGASVPAVSVATTTIAASGGGGGAWTPTSLGAILKSWYDANDLASFTKDGSNNVSQINDKSASGINLTASGAARPVYVSASANINNKPTFRMTRGSTYISGAGNLVGSMYQAALLQNNFQTQYFHAGPVSGQAFTGPSAAGAGFGTAAAHGCFWSTTTVDNYTNCFSQNGNLLANANGNVQTPAEPAMIFVVAKSNSGNYGVPFGLNSTTVEMSANGGWDGDVSEAIFVRGTYTTLDRQKLEGYLAWKWGFESALPADHPYKSAAP